MVKDCTCVFLNRTNEPGIERPKDKSLVVSLALFSCLRKYSLIDTFFDISVM